VPRLKRPSGVPLAKLSPQQRAELDTIERNAILYFQGKYNDLERALGILRMGHHVGWKVLHIVHSPKSITKYEKVLGVRLRDNFPAEGPSSCRSRGFNGLSGVTNFWGAVIGSIFIANRTLFTVDAPKKGTCRSINRVPQNSPRADKHPV
jgi:hypothetical protein